MNNYQEYTVRVFDNRTEWLNKDGQYHRVDGPAIEYTSGGKSWYLNGKLYRVDGPAVEYANGDKEWYLNDKELTEAEHKKQTAKPVETTCDVFERSEEINGETVEIRGKKYRLTII